MPCFTVFLWIIIGLLSILSGAVQGGDARERGDPEALFSYGLALQGRGDHGRAATEFGRYIH